MSAPIVAGIFVLGALTGLMTRSGPKHPAPQTITEAEYEAIHERHRRQARSAFAGLSVMGLALVGLLAGIAGFLPDSGRPVTAGHLVSRVLDAMTSFGRSDPLAVVLALVGVEATLAVAVAATKIDPEATAPDTMWTQRWLDALRSSTALAAAGAGYTTACTVILILREDELSGAEPVVVIVAAVSWVLGGSLTRRSEALAERVGLRVQKRRNVAGQAALRQICGRELPMLRLALAPVAALFLAASVDEATSGSPIHAVARLGLGLLITGWLAAALQWARVGAGRAAATWAVGGDLRGLRLMLAACGTVGSVFAAWSLIGLIVAWRIAPSDWRWATLAAALAVWPILPLAIDCWPRLTVTRVEARMRVRLRPTRSAAVRALASLERRAANLEANLTEITTSPKGQA